MYKQDVKNMHIIKLKLNVVVVSILVLKLCYDASINRSEILTN